MTTQKDAKASVIDKIYPLTPMQQGMLYHCVHDDRAGNYIEQVVYELKGVLHPDVLTKAVGDVVQRHDALRTVFFHENVSRLSQVVLKKLPVSVGRRDLREIDLPQRADAVAYLADQERLRPFVLRQGPLVRVLLIQVGLDSWYLVWTFHHLIMDGWCLGLLTRDLVIAYSARLGGTDPMFSEAPQFQTFVDWLAQRSAGADLAFWRNQLQGRDGVTSLPFPVAVPGGPYRPSEVSVSLSSKLCAGLEDLAHIHGTTLAALIHAIWALELAWITDSDDVVFGSVTSGRPTELAGARDIVGLFINTLPIRLQVNDDEAFCDLLHRAGTKLRAMLAHAQIPLTKIQSDLCAGRDAFDHLLGFENYPVPELAEGELPFEFIGVTSHGQTNYDFNLAVQLGVGLDIHCRYNESRFAEADVQRVLKLFTGLICRIIEEPRATVGQLKTLSGGEQDRVIKVSRGQEIPVAHGDILEALRAQVLIHRDAPALSDATRSWTYQEIDQLSGKIAQGLVERGVGKRDVVALMLGRTPEHFIAALGVMKAGAVFLPIDTNYPPERIAFMLADSCARLSVRCEREPVMFGGPEVSFEDLVAEESPFVRVFVQAEDPAYLIYTSGSTGRPKGALIAHRGIPNLTECFRRDFGLGLGDRILQFASVSFDASIWEMCAAFLTGAELVVASDATLQDLERFHGLLETRKITVALLPPSYLGNADPSRFTSVRLLISGGSEAKSEVIEAFLDPKRVVLNAYGPTEMTIISSYHVCQSGEQRIPIGPPIANTGAVIQDSKGRLLPFGIPGELCLTGVGMGLGYLARPDIPAERFLFSDVRRYRTGDLARWNEEGELVYQGRIDRQIKLRGFRIELDEIEETIRSVAGIQDACVVQQEQGGSSFLHAFYVGAADPAVQMRASLPVYMVPEHVTRLDALPLTPNLKIDRLCLEKQLPEVGSAEIEVPRSEKERAALVALSEVLETPDFGIADDFFRHGGDSIKAIQAAAKLQKSGWRLEVADLMARRTVKACSDVIVPYNRPVSQAPVAGPVRLPYVAQWFADLGAPSRFNQALLLNAKEWLDASALEVALQAVIKHHDGLRLTWTDVPGTGLILPPESVHIKVERRIAPTGVHVPQWLADECEAAHDSFDLSRAPLLRVRLLECSGEQRLLLVAHHLIVDAVTWRIILEDLVNVYADVLSGRPVKLDEKTMSQDEWLTLRLAELPLLSVKETDLWRSMALDPVTDFPGESILSTQGERLTRDLVINKQATSRFFDAGAEKLKANAAELLLAALVATVRDLWGVSSTRVLLESLGRDERVSRTCGWFTSLYPVRFDLAGDDLAVVIKVKETMRRIPDQGIGYGLLRLAADTPLSHDLASAEPPPIMFNYLGDVTPIFGKFFEAAEEEVGNPVGDDVPRTAVLEVNAFQRDGALYVSISSGFEQLGALRLGALATALPQKIGTLTNRLAEGQGVLTPSDVGFEDLTVDDLAALGDDLLDLD